MNPLLSPAFSSPPPKVLIMSRTRRQAEALPSGSQVQTESSREPSPLPLTGTLRLRGAPLAETTQTTTETASTRRIRWSEDVVDNEGMGKKSSKGKTTHHMNRGLLAAYSQEILSFECLFLSPLFLPFLNTKHKPLYEINPKSNPRSKTNEGTNQYAAYTTNPTP